MNDDNKRLREDVDWLLELFQLMHRGYRGDYRVFSTTVQMIGRFLGSRFDAPSPTNHTDEVDTAALRAEGSNPRIDYTGGLLIQAAADEIDRLRVRVAALAAEKEQKT